MALSTMTAKFQPDETLKATFGSTIVTERTSYNFGAGIKYDAETGTVSVDTAQTVLAGDVRPVSSAAVAVEIGNVEALLQTI